MHPSLACRHANGAEIRKQVARRTSRFEELKDVRCRSIETWRLSINATWRSIGWLWAWMAHHAR